jgi:hypothetical protein
MKEFSGISRTHLPRGRHQRLPFLRGKYSNSHQASSIKKMCNARLYWARTVKGVDADLPDLRRAQGLSFHQRLCNSLDLRPPRRRIDQILRADEEPTPIGYEFAGIAHHARESVEVAVAIGARMMPADARWTVLTLCDLAGKRHDCRFLEPKAHPSIQQALRISRNVLVRVRSADRVLVGKNAHPLLSDGDVKRDGSDRMPCFVIRGDPKLRFRVFL